MTEEPKDSYNDNYSEQLKNQPAVFDHGIMKVIVFASIIIIFSMIFISTIVYSITENEVVTKLKSKDLVYIAESISAKINGRIDRAIETSLVLSRDPEIIKWVSEGEKNDLTGDHVLKKIMDLPQNLGYSNSFIVSALTKHYWAENGKIIDTMSPNDPDDNWFFETISSKKAVSINIDYNMERKDTFVFINSLVGNPDHPLAVTGVGISLKDLSNEFQNFKYGEDSDLWLIDNQGNIYLSDNVKQNGKNLQDFIPGTIKEQVIKNFKRENTEFFNLDYKNSKGQLIDLISYPVESADLNLILQIPRSNTIYFLNKIKLNAIAATLISLILITFIFYFVSRNLANPYKKALQKNQELENKVLERTRELYEKNQKLMDSLDYAQRIQKSILPSKSKLTNIFKEHFLLWKPKDLVGGDFYWVKKFGKDCLVAVGDCTGHGVPGALMSMLTISILNQISTGEGKKDPALILKKLNNLIKQILNQQNREALTDDGLDIALCYYNGKSTLIFAGAKCSLYIKSKGELKIIKGDKKSIGYIRTEQDYPYNNNAIDIYENDTFYLTTDGYLDQNGGPKNHSFGKKRFTEIIDKCYDKQLSEQYGTFLKELINYMGDETQRDDITLIAFKLTIF